MTYTVIITREFDPDAYVATVPLLDVVTYGDTVEEAVAAAREAITLDLRGRQRHQEDIPIEADDYAVLRRVDVDLPASVAPRELAPPARRQAS